MASASSASQGVEGYDVFISYPEREVAWAQRLARDLSELGLRSFLDLELRAGEQWSEALREALEQSGALVVLWSSSAETSKGVRTEIARFDALIDEEGRSRLIVPVLLGDADLLRGAPRELSSRQALIIGRDAYAAGPEADHEEWRRAVREVARAVAAQRASIIDASGESAAEPEAPLVSLSGGAQRALSYAAELLGDAAVDAERVRTAALLGALWVSASSNMTPSTGDVVRLVLERQTGRDAWQTLSAAAAAAGLRPIKDPEAPAMSLEALVNSNARQLVDEASVMQRRTDAERIHLHHVLAVGVHPAVSPEALAELHITLNELRAEWRASIARTWPDESQEAWDEILVDRPEEAHDTTAPPSARVHADRWTTHDRLDYALYAKAIAEFIRHPDAKPPMVISVQAPWGQGKTSLMRMVQHDLDPEHPDLRRQNGERESTAIAEPPSELTFGELRDSLDGTVTVGDVKPKNIRTVWFNAWKYQSSEQVWAGLAHAILAQLPARLSAKDRELFWLRLQLRRIDPSAVRADIHQAVLERFLPRLAGWAVLVLGTVVVIGLALLAGGLGALGVVISGGGVLGTAWLARRAWATATEDVLKRPLEGAYLRYVRQPDYASKLGYLHLVEEDMTRALDLLTPDNQPAVIFIDDLDRCSPAKVGEVIEAMNLFLAGEYPNCAFVIGIDAEVVAASMEVVHAEIISKLADRRGELGWHFLDKFVQLPFVIPRLHPDQRDAYLRSLFSTPQDAEARERVVAEADLLESDVLSESLPVDELARRVGELAPRLAAVAPDRARALGEEVVSAGARAFSDNDPEVIEALAGQMRYLSDNPRTIKRAVNLYRFHRFAAFARQASTLPLEVATPEQIGRWVVVIIRWPHFVRWLQAQRDGDSDLGNDPTKRVLAVAADADTHQSFQESLRNYGIGGAWTDDAELWEFLHAEAPSDLSLHLAGSRGLW